tara:strand:- start:359 stop:499 length:141 start_codon:yes stop_codon:yes gene_type:complete
MKTEYEQIISSYEDDSHTPLELAEIYNMTIEQIRWVIFEWPKGRGQ